MIAYGNFSCFLFRPLIFSVNFFQKFFREYHVKQFGSRSGWKFDLGPICLQRYEHMTLLGKELSLSLH